MTPNTDAIFYRCVHDRWYVIVGHLSDKYNRGYYRDHGPHFATRDDAVTHAKELAKRRGIPESEIFEDLGADDY